MSSGRRLLVVVYDYPPSLSTAAVRWTAMSKYLAAMGHSVTVVTSDSFGLPTASDPVQVLRPRSLETSWPLNRRRFVNPRLGWAPVAFREARRLLGRQTFDCLITSSPPESAHLVGLLLSRRRPPWVADFRDGWCFEPYTTRFRTRAQLFVDARLERRVVLAADIAVGATPPIAEDLASRLGVQARWIPNGWDPVAVDADATPSPTDAAGGLRLVYTGRLWGPGGRTPESLFRALKAVASEADLPRLRLVHAGTLAPEDQALIDRTGVADLVQHVGILNRAEVAALQRSADVLLLLTARVSSHATGKLFEYFAAGKPILALADGNEAERLVRQTGTGVVVPPDDVEAIAEALRSAARGDLVRHYKPQGLERYSYPHLAEEMADVIEEAISVGASPGKS